MLRTIVVAAAVAALLTAGGSAAAARLLSGKDIRNSSLTGKDVRNSSLTGADVKNGSLQVGELSGPARRALQGKTGPQGPAGPAGATGPAGPTGPAGAAGRDGRTKVVYLPESFTNIANGQAVVGSLPLPQGTWLVEVNVVAQQPFPTSFTATCNLQRGATQLSSGTVYLATNPETGYMVLDAPVIVPEGGATLDVVCNGPGGGKDIDYSASGWATSVDDLTVVGG